MTQGNAIIIIIINIIIIIIIITIIINIIIISTHKDSDVFELIKVHGNLFFNIKNLWKSVLIL